MVTFIFGAVVGSLVTIIALMIIGTKRSKK